jgi:V-type H+-transporting ATPase subunit d
VRKIWLNEFFDFCEVNLEETSAHVMSDLVKFEADCQTIQIIANSLMVGGMPNSVNRDMERRKYISKVGYLYPERDEKLRNVSDIRSLVQAVENTPYEKILSVVAQNDDRNEA